MYSRIFNKTTAVSLATLAASLLATSPGVASAQAEILNNARAYLWAECFPDPERYVDLDVTRGDGFNFTTRRWDNADGHRIIGVKRLNSGVDHQCIIYPGLYPYGSFMPEVQRNYLDDLFSVGGSTDDPRGIPRWFKVKDGDQLDCSALVVKKIAGMWKGTSRKEWYAEPHCVVVEQTRNGRCPGVPIGALPGNGDIDDNANGIRDEFEVYDTLPNGNRVHSAVEALPDLNNNGVHDSFESCMTGNTDNDNDGIDDGVTIPVANPIK